MNVVTTHHTLENLDFKRVTRLPHQFPCTGSNITTQNVFPVLGGPDEVVLDVVGSMTSVAVFHSPSGVAES